MEIRNFSEFLLEKKKDKSESKDTEENSGDPKIWKPGSGPWFLEYFSQIKSEKDSVNIIKITEEVLLKLAKEGFSNVDSSFKWEKLYQFAKYCLKGEKFNYPSFARDKKKDSKTEPGLISEILEIDVYGKSIDKILSNNVKNDDLAKYTLKIYENIKKFIKESSKAEILFGDKKPGEFNDSGVISLLAGLYQPKNVEEGKPIFITEDTPVLLKTPGKDGKGWNGKGTDKTLEDKKKAGEWKLEWSIPIDPERVKDLIKNSESCVRQSNSCIGEIKILLSEEAKKAAEEKIEAIYKITDEMKKVKEILLGKQEEKEGGETGVIYTFWREFEAAKTDSDKIKLIMGDKGLTGTLNDKFLKNFEGVEKIIQEARNLVDSGEMSQKEYFRNIETYREDGENKSVSVGEGLKKVMYEEVKDGISNLQAAIDNYTSGSGGKNALSQYLKVYNEFIDKNKSQYTITGEGNDKKIEIPGKPGVKDGTDDTGKGKNKNKK